MRELILGFGLFSVMACTGEKNSNSPENPDPSEPEQPISEPNQPTSEPSEPSEPDDPLVETVEYQELSPVKQLLRISMALRGTRPSMSELQRALQDPESITVMALEFTETPEFIETVADLYAEVLLMRATALRMPSIGALSSESQKEIHNTMAEEPLNILREVVRSDAPFTDIVSADWTILDEVGSRMWGYHDYDSSGEDLQVVHYTDTRPSAGMITTNGFLTRHGSAGSNFNRGRVNTITKTFLCTDFTDRDIPLSGEIDLSDDAAVAEAVFTQTECVGCHQSMDPLGAQLWGPRAQLTQFAVLKGHNEGACDFHWPCYPIPMYNPGATDNWQNKGLRGPNYFGYQSDTLSDMGANIAADPRFSQCVSRRMLSYLQQQDLDAAPLEEVVQFQELFEASDFSIKTLAASIVTSPAFLAKSASPESFEDSIPGIQVIRPEQLQRLYSSLLGFNFVIGLTNGGNGGAPYGNFNAMTDDSFGFRAMAGGVDGYRVTFPTHTATPVRLLVMALMADEAASAAVEHDLLSTETPRLLTGVTIETTDEGLLRLQLKKLHLQILGESVDVNSSEIDDSLALFLEIESSSDIETAWKVLLSAFFQSPDMLYY